MFGKFFVVCICIILLYSCCASAQLSLTFTLPASVTGLQVGSRTEAVFVAAGSRLFRLDTNLAQQEDVTLSDSVLNIALSHDESVLVVCFRSDDAGTCMGYNAGNFTEGPQFIAEESFADTNITALFTSPDGDSFYVGSFGPRINTSENIMQVTQHGLRSATNTQAPTPALYLSSVADMERNISHGFVSGPNAYFIALDRIQDNGTSPAVMRVIRVCHDEIHNGLTSDSTVAVYETELECGRVNNLDSICGVSLLSSLNGVPEPTVLLSQCGGLNRVCSYKLADIDLAMDNTYSQCSEGQGTVLSPVWTGSTSFPCSSFEVRKTSGRPRFH